MTDFNQKTHDTDVGSHGGQSRQMMEVFENQEFGSIRVLQEAGKTFFCASDVAKALGYVNPYAAVKRHCRGFLTKREGVVQKVNQYGDAGEQVVEIAFITEGDVYRLIVHSKLPSTERFEHWVFDESSPVHPKAWCVYERFHFGSGDSASGGHLHPGTGACSREGAA